MKAHEQDGPALRRWRIMVADDDPEMRWLLATALRHDGHEVTEAADGDDLLRQLASARHADALEPPDLVISDVRMPGMSGLDVLGAIRRAGLTVPVVVFTAFGDAATHARARALGACATLDKPFDLDDLRSLVRGLVRRP